MTEARTPAPGEVRLRPVLEEDLPIFFEHQLDPEATRMAAFSSRDREAFMTHWARIRRDPAVVLRTIVFNGMVAGNAVSWDQSGRREIGYWLGREYWGRGIASRALAAFLEQIRVRPLFAHVAQQNIASRRVLEKCGFTIWSRGTITEPDGSSMEEFLLKLDSDPDDGGPDRSSTQAPENGS